MRNPSRRRCAILKALRGANGVVAGHLSAEWRRIVDRGKSRSDDEISLADLVATYAALVHSGAPIAEINTIRKHLSAVKGGRLAQAAFPATAGFASGPPMFRTILPTLWPLADDAGHDYRG